MSARVADVAASPPAASPTRPLSLAAALAIMVGGSVYPFMFAGQGGRVDHGFASAVFWAMSAGLVNGVGFKPRFVLWRWLFSGWACLFALLLAACLRLA
ncbi:MAG: cyd operon YbgE family protein [Rhodoferax sp.]|uniref:cyd operon YbgE family protein n=1 Tax=Rhodoferax sp. TaxID=50421 RepID=UPI0027377733|nr:cyd operon YbgE family protein [Rhodoferax sp.]MDP2677489.1 cyd operon YbgE family protein [Rhodoferax sp.]